MVKMNHFSSGDFNKVPDELIEDKPKQLIHENVLNSEISQDLNFSNERRHKVAMVNLPSKVLSMTLGGLQPGESTRKHRHSYETIIYIVNGEGYSLIGEQHVSWKAGDAIYVPVWAWHQHINSSVTDEALYIACENAPMLQNLGLAVREEL
ncbi:cupin domain-containing protein [Photorhabdus sp. APURE]|uniref:cupin domain-containing protein n=1 Tax=Photorhabdus aballayi TaxID=2991723 RepID=UPI00223E0D78|nr:cupin domain-containing protein [Photorhabdus aballayi]MCW7548140.1 cupin domain-containing protein [Photorhabdus aballayi]